MKQKFLIAAGLLCLGTSPALAYAMPDMAPDMAKAVKQVWADQTKAEQPSIFETGEAWMGTAKAPKPSFAAATVEKDAIDMPAKSDASLAMAGPSEPVMQPSAIPAAAAYPACRRDAADDHCIQLYEPGVRAQIAEWNRSASGAGTAMGGPYEPADSTLAGEMGGSSMPAGAQYTGTGGPLETVDYPPCSRTVTDRCIQLYERGVHR